MTSYIYKTLSVFLYCRHLKNNQPLGFDYRLFDKIQPEKCQIKVGANDVRLTLTKQQKGKWSRLLKEKQKVSVSAL